jgi:hypothetical protein
MKTKTGTKEWAQTNVNFQEGCEHDCRYCFARGDAVGRWKRCTAEQWRHPVINQAKVDKHRGKYPGVVMFPSTHDVTPLNFSEYLTVLRRLLDAGNQVLVVSKPHWQCITVLCEAYQEYKSQIMFRFTIGSMDDAVLGFWEPNAPNFAERLSCLEYAFHKGFRTSVSCEPYLDPYVVYTYTACKPFITDSFWVGMLRHFERRVDLTGATAEQIEKFVKPLKAAQGLDVVKGIHRLLDGQPFIHWKDSIREALATDGTTRKTNRL